MEETFWDSYGDEISAAIAVVASILLAFAVDRFLLGRADRATQRLDTTQFSREARTRLRLIRRLVFLTIVLVGVVLALSQFTEIRRVATGLLASTAVLALIIGVAGRTVIANLISGVQMAITQPIRIGDRVTVGEETGRVLDISLTATSLDSGGGKLTVVPNERLVTEVVVNHSAGNPRAPAVVSVWLPPGADLEAARAALEGVGASAVRVAELTPEGARMELKGPMEAGRDRETRESELLERAHAALLEAGTLSET